MIRAQLTVLLVEDRPADAALIEGILARPGMIECTLTWVQSLSDAIEQLDERAFDAALVDLSLPDARGLEAVYHLGQVAPDLPVVVLTGRDEAALGLDAVEAGAADFLVKARLDRALLARSLYHATTRSRTERALVEQRNLLRAVLESQADAVVVIDREGELRMRNPAAARLLGSQVDAVIQAAGEQWYQGIAHRPMSRSTRPITRAARGEAVDGAEIFIEGRAGEPGRWLSANIRPIELDGRITGGVAVFRDITERRAREAQVTALNAELGKQIAERTRALVAVEAADRLKRQFLDVVSHELRTPLTPILGYARLLLRKGERLEPDQREALEHIEESGLRMQQIVESILDFQRLRAEPVVPTPRPTHLRALLEQVMTVGRALIDEAPVELRLVVEPTVPPVVALDGPLVEQILTRLVENAVTYTPHGGVELRARWQADAVEIAVVDSGVGIDGEHLDFIFGAFYQVHSPMTRPHGGLGLGLAHARFLAEALGGALEVRSAPDEGSEFVLRLPAPAEAPRAGEGPAGSDLLG